MLKENDRIGLSDVSVSVYCIISILLLELEGLDLRAIHPLMSFGGVVQVEGLLEKLFF